MNNLQNVEASRSPDEQSTKRRNLPQPAGSICNLRTAPATRRNILQFADGSRSPQEHSAICGRPPQPAGTICNLQKLAANPRQRFGMKSYSCGNKKDHLSVFEISVLKPDGLFLFHSMKRAPESGQNEPSAGRFDGLPTHFDEGNIS